jgi:FkbM family methyltransferase
MDGPIRVPPDYEALIQRLYEELLLPGDVAFDVGAHLGRHTLPMAECVGPGGRVVAFEPLPDCLASLRKEAEPRRVEIHNCALGASAGPAEFVVAVDLPPSSGLRERIYDRPTRLERLPVRVRTLDEMTAALPALRLIKIDVEGGELDVLRGGRRTLRRLRPVVVFEFGLRATGNYDATPAALCTLLAEEGYHLYGIDGPRLDVVGFTRSATEQSIHDYVAVPSEDARTTEDVEGVLGGPTLLLLQAEAALVAARHHAACIGRPPAMAPLPAWLRPPAHWAGRLAFWVARPFLAPQRRSQEASVAALAAMLEAVRAMERRSSGGRRDRRRASAA